MSLTFSGGVINTYLTRNFAPFQSKKKKIAFFPKIFAGISRKLCIFVENLFNYLSNYY